MGIKVNGRDVPDIRHAGYIRPDLGISRISGSAGYPIRQRRISGIRQVPDIRQILEYSGCIDYREISKIIVLSYFVLYFRVEVKYPAENPAIRQVPDIRSGKSFLEKSGIRHPA